jgi:hypothetical protein
LIGTARAYFVILNTYAIQRIRNPITLTINFATWRIAYGLTGHHQIAGASVSGFLLIGSFGNIIWFSTLWSSGFAIERARHEGTSAALFLSGQPSYGDCGVRTGALAVATPPSSSSPWLLCSVVPTFTWSIHSLRFSPSPAWLPVR